MKNMKSSLIVLAGLFALSVAGCRSGNDAGLAGSGGFTIAVTKTQTGSATGSLVSNPTGLTCGTTCATASATFPAGSSVTVTATAATGFFNGWGGFPGCGTAPTCVVTASGGTLNINAAFGDAPTPGNVAVLTPSGKLVTFESATPAIARTAQLVSGLLAGETVIGIDYIPTSVSGANPVLVGVSKLPSGGGRLFQLDPATGAIGSAVSLTSAPATDYTGLDGTRFGLDYNPVTLSLRLVGDGTVKQNLSIVTSGANAGRVTVDTNLNDSTTAGPVGAVSAAYTNNYLEAKAAILYVINPSSRKLYVQNNLSGDLYEIATLGAGQTEISDFDIKGTGRGIFGAALYVATAGGGSNLYSLDLATGISSLLSGPVNNRSIPVPLNGLDANPISEGVIALTIKPGAQQLIGDTLALTSDNELISFNRSAPNLLLKRNTIPRLYSPGTKPVRDHLIGLDVNPVTGVMYALSQQSRLYTVNQESGLGTFVAELSGAGFSGLLGTNFGVDFNPTNGLLRVVSDTGQNLRVDVGTGSVTVQPTLRRGTTPAVATGAAYTNNLPAAASTTLYDLDTSNSASTVLATQDQATGALTNVGTGLGFGATGGNGFDIDGLTGNAFAALVVNGVTNLYKINLGSGTAVGASSGLASATTADRIGTGAEPLLGLTMKAPVVNVYALTAAGRIIGINPVNPAVLTLDKAVSNLPAAETLVTLDYRTSDKKLYGVTSSGKIYSIDISTATTPVNLAAPATLVKAMAPSADDQNSPFFSSFGSATQFGSDFDPRVADALASLRIVTVNSPGAFNIRTSTVSGNTFQDSNLAVVNTTTGGPLIPPPVPGVCNDSAAPQVGAIAYSNDVTVNKFYAINSNTSCLYSTDPVAGTMNGIGKLGVTLSSAATGLDIGGAQDGMALAALDTGATQSSLYKINLATGVATSIGAIGPAATPKISSLSVSVQANP